MGIAKMVYGIQTLRKLLLGTLIFQMSVLSPHLSNCSAKDQVSTQQQLEGAFDDSAVTEESSDVSTTKTYEMESTQNTAKAADVLSYISLLVSSGVGTMLLIKCPQLVFQNASSSVYVIGSLAHIAGEIVNLAIYYDKIQTRATLYQEKVTISSGGDYNLQLEGLEQARGLHEDTKKMLIFKQVLTAAVSATYTAAAIIATVEATKDSTPVAGWVSQLVDNIRNGVAGAACAATSLNQKHDEDEMLFSALAYSNRSLIKNDQTPIESYMAYKEWMGLLKGKNSSPSIGEYKSANKVFKSMPDQSIFGQFSSSLKRVSQIFEGVLIARAHAETYEGADATVLEGASTNQSEVKSSGWQKIGGIFTKILLPVAGITVLLMSMKNVVAGIMQMSYSRAVYLWVVAGLSIPSNIVIAVEQGKIKKRIEQYDRLIADLTKLQGNNLDEGTEKEQHHRVLPEGETSNSVIADGCVDSSLVGDSACDCLKTNSCYSLEQEGVSRVSAGLNFPSWANKTLGSTTDSVDALSSGNFNGALGSATSAAKFGARMRPARDIAAGLLKNGLGKGMTLDKASSLLGEGLSAHIKKSLGGDASSKFKGLAFGDLLPSDQKISKDQTIKDMKELTKSIVDTKNRTLGAKGASDFQGFNFDSKTAAERKVKVKDEGRALKGYRADYGEIRDSDESLFKILHSRYIQSYPLLLERK